MKRNLIQAFLAVLTLSLFISAQNAGSPYVVDEFGKINSEDLTARLDNYANEYLKFPNVVAGILIGRGEKDSLGFQYRYATRIKTYLTKNRGIPSNKVIIVQIGKANYTSVMLYLVPSGSERGLINNGKNDFADEYDSSKTFLFDSYDYTDDYADDLGTCCVIDNYKKEEAESSLIGISEIIKESPKSKIHLAAYICMKCQNSEGKFKPDSAKLIDKMLKEAKDILSKSGIEDSSIVTIKGRTESFRGVEIWFVPKGGETPKPKPDYFPKKRRLN